MPPPGGPAQATLDPRAPLADPGQPADPAPPGHAWLGDACLLYFLGLLWHGAWATRADAPWDWDPSYYLGVAEQIHAGHGAATDALWNLGWLPPTLLHPADLHWMPLPSRWLVPFLSLPLSSWRAAQVATVGAAAGWGPLAGAWGRRLGLGRGAALVAGVAGALGGGYVRFLSVPDSIAVYGLVGGFALYAASRGWVQATVGAVAAAALCRSDGFLLAPVCALAWVLAGGARTRTDAVIVAMTGPLVTALWLGRNALVAGWGAVAVRARAMQALDPTEWLQLTPPPSPGVGERLTFVADHLSALARTWIVTPGLLGLPLLLLGAWRLAPRGPQRLLAPSLLYFFGLPPVLYLLAPAVAFEGSAFRSLAAALPAVVALAVAGAARLTRRYPEPFLPAVAVALSTALCVSAATAPGQFPSPLPDCEALAAVPEAAPIFSYDPLGTSTRCGHPGVILGRAPAADLAELADRYGIRWALTAPDGYASWTLEDGQAAAALPGWRRVAPRLWKRTPGDRP